MSGRGRSGGLTNAQQRSVASSVSAPWSAGIASPGYEDAATYHVSPNYRIFAVGDEGIGYAYPKAGRGFGVAQSGNDVMWGTAGYMSSKTTTAGTAGGITFGPDICNWNLSAGNSLIFACVMKGSAPGAALRILGNSQTQAFAGWGVTAQATGKLGLRVADGTNQDVGSDSINSALDGTDKVVVVMINGATKVGYIWVGSRLTLPTGIAITAATASTLSLTQPMTLGNAGNTAASASHAIAFKNVHLLTMAGGLPTNFMQIANWLQLNIEKPIPRAMLNETVAPEYVVPVTSAATTAAKKLQRLITRYSGSREFMVGMFDRHHGNNEPAADGNYAAFRAMSGEYPACMHWAYQDTAAPAYAGHNSTGAQRNAALIADIKAVHRAGGINMVSCWTGNPARADGGLASGLYNQPAYNDRATATPAAAMAGCKSGGAYDAQFTGWLDRLAVFFEALVDDSGNKIPIMFRPFVEVNGDWFWFGGTTSAADFILVWQRMVTYLSVTKGVTNVLYCWNINVPTIATGGVDDNATTAYTTWYPGDSYVDIVSADYYNNTAYSASVNLSLRTYTRTGMAALEAIAATSRKPLMTAEVGFQYGANVTTLWSQLGDDVAYALRSNSMVLMWRPPWGPANTDASAASLQTLVGRQFCLTLADIAGWNA